MLEGHVLGSSAIQLHSKACNALLADIGRMLERRVEHPTLSDTVCTQRGGCCLSITSWEGRGFLNNPQQGSRVAPHVTCDMSTVTCDAFTFEIYLQCHKDKLNNRAPKQPQYTTQVILLLQALRSYLSRTPGQLRP